MASLDFEQRNLSHVRIWSSFQPVGGGFVVGERLIMTCAHVVLKSLGSDPELDETGRPTGTVFVDSLAVGNPPVRRDPNSLLSARVVAGKWMVRDRNGGGDIALLELCPGQKLPDRARIAVRSDRPITGAGFSAYGILAARNADGTVFFLPKVVDGKLKGPLSGRAFQVGSDLEETAVREGCSGAAVWEEGGGVVGMVVSWQERMSGVMIPVDVLEEVYSIPREGHVRRRALRPSRAGRASNLALQLQDRLRSFDRIEQVDRFKLLLRDQWDSNRKPVVCTIAGLALDRPEWCRDRCQDEGVNPRLAKMKVDAAAVVPQELAWPREAEFDLDLHFDLLLNKVRDLLDARNARPETIRTAFNRESLPFLFHSLVPESAVRGGGDRHIELLRRWMEFWAAVGEGRLKRPFVHFLVLRLDAAAGESASAGEAAYRAFYDRMLAGLGLNERLSLPLLRQTFEHDEVDKWLKTVGRELRLPPARLVVVQAEARKLFRRVPEPRLADLETWLEELSL